jgi:hypothetical protein
METKTILVAMLMEGVVSSVILLVRLTSASAREINQPHPNQA